MSNTGKNDIKQIVLIAGAVLAFLVGSGVATGQEIMQFYTPWGYKMIGTAAVIAIILMLANHAFAYAGSRGQFEKGSEVFSFYCGPIVGKGFDYFSVFFCYLSYIVMIGGGSSVLKQQYGFPLIVGGIIIVVLAAFTVSFGLDSIVDAIGKIGPTMMLLLFVIALIALFMSAGHIPENIKKIDSGEIEVLKASKNWFLAAISNAGFCILWLAGFMSQLGAKTEPKIFMKGQIIGTIVLVIVITIIGYALLGNIGVVHSLQIPNLYLAAQIFKPLAYIFGVLIFAAIYTTACPLLWTASSRFTQEGTSNFKIVTVLLALVGLIVALYVPFNILLNYVYVINGYAGAVLFVWMLIKLIMMRFGERKQQSL
jgi:uncharacterized membrane protein YkvI